MPKKQEFKKKVYAEIENLPKGKVTTYSSIAKKIGNPKSSRAVGNALRNYPLAPNGNCYRVVRSDGRVGGYCGKTSGKIYIQKVKKLEAIGCKIGKNGKILNFKEKKID